MIQANVRLYHPKRSNRWIDESPINQWLLTNVGTGESFRNRKVRQCPWYVEHFEKYLVYHFAREQDAVMFALRWA